MVSYKLSRHWLQKSCIGKQFDSHTKDLAKPPNPSSTKPPNRILPPPFQKEKRKRTHREIPTQTQQPNLKQQNLS